MHKALRSSAIVVTFLLGLGATPAGALEVGDKAPDFELPSTLGGKFRLSDNAGKKSTIIQFYVLDFTPT